MSNASLSLAAAFDQKKAGRIAIKLLSTAGTGFFYTATKNVRTTTGKLALRKVRVADTPTCSNDCFKRFQTDRRCCIRNIQQSLFNRKRRYRITSPRERPVTAVQQPTASSECFCFWVQGWSAACSFKSHCTHKYIHVPGCTCPCTGYSFCSRGMWSGYI